MIKHVQRLRLALGAAVVSAGLVCASFAVAAPRPSGNAPAPAAEAPAAAVTAVDGTYTRSDMPRPSGTVTPLGLETAKAAETSATPSKLPEKKAAASTTDAAADAAAADDGWSPDMDCTTCHNPDDVKAATEGSTVLTDINGTVVNPHERPDGEAHDENPATCTDCHNNHSKDLSKDAMKYCAQCHHRGIFQCGTCHEIRERSVA